MQKYVHTKNNKKLKKNYLKILTGEGVQCLERGAQQEDQRGQEDTHHTLQNQANKMK